MSRYKESSEKVFYEQNPVPDLPSSPSRTDTPTDTQMEIDHECSSFDQIDLISDSDRESNSEKLNQYFDRLNLDFNLEASNELFDKITDETIDQETEFLLFNSVQQANEQKFLQKLTELIHRRKDIIHIRQQTSKMFKRNYLAR